MKNMLNSVLISFLVIFTFTPTILAQDSPQWHLPDRVKARYGKGNVHEIKYSPDGTMMAVASAIGIWIYDVQTTEARHLLSGHTRAVRSIDFNADGTQIVSGSVDETVRVWDVAMGIEVNMFTGHTDTVSSVAFNPDGNTIASGSYDKTVRLWDISMGYELHSFTQHTEGITSVIFNHDGSQLASAGWDNLIHLFDVNGRKHLRTFTGSENSIRSIAFSPGGTKIASGGLDKKVHLYDVASANKLHTLEGHTSHINSVAFTPNGLMVGSGSHDKTIRIWNVNSGTERMTLTDNLSWVNSIAFSPDGKVLAGADSDGTIQVWQGYTIYTARQTRTFTRHQRNWDTLLFKQDGKQMAMNAVDNVIRLREVDTSNLLRTYIGHTDDIRSIDITDDGRYLVSGSRDGTMRLWDVETGSELHTLSKFVGTIDTVVFSPDGKSVAGLSDFQDSNIVIYDVQTGVELRGIRAFALPPLGRPWTFLQTAHSHPVNTIAFSPRGDTIASCSSDETVRLWDVQTGKHLRVMIGHTDSVSQVSFSPDGRVLLSSSRDNTIRLWDVETGAEIRQFSGGSEGIRSVTFSPDGNTIVTGEDDSTIRFWNYHSGVLSHTFTGHKGSVTRLVFSPDGQTLASRSADGTVLIWDVTNLIPSNTLVSLSPVSMVSPEVGEPLTLFLNITGGQNIAGYQAKVHYDTTALRYANSANGDYLPANAFFAQPVVDVNNVQLASVAYGQEVDGDGTLASITFEVIAVKNSAVRLSHVLLTNSTGTGETPQTAFAEITEPPIRPEDVNEDGVVDVSDLLFVAKNFGEHGTHAADVNADGEVNVIDLALVAAAIGSDGSAAPALSNIHPDDMPTRPTVQTWLNLARQRNISDPSFQRGITVLEHLLISLTPTETSLLSNYPNPFNPETWIPYQLSAPADVRITIYASDGTLVRQLDMGYQPIGIYHHRSRAAYWDGKNDTGETVASGVYFYMFRAGSFSATRKMLIRK